MDLILWRHADAFEARYGQADADRELTPKGEEQAAFMGQWLDSVLTADTRILVSPARRTQQTAAALGRPFETSPAVASGASVKSVLEAVGWPRSKQPVLVVGHQPTIGLTAARLMCGFEQYWSVHKAGVWWLHGERDDGQATLVTMRVPGL